MVVGGQDVLPHAPYAPGSFSGQGKVAGALSKRGKRRYVTLGFRRKAGRLGRGTLQALYDVITVLRSPPIHTAQPPALARAEAILSQAAHRYSGSYGVLRRNIVRTISSIIARLFVETSRLSWSTVLSSTNRATIYIQPLLASDASQKSKAM